MTTIQTLPVTGKSGVSRTRKPRLSEIIEAEAHQVGQLMRPYGCLAATPAALQVWFERLWEQRTLAAAREEEGDSDEQDGH